MGRKEAGIPTIPPRVVGCTNSVFYPTLLGIPWCTSCIPGPTHPAAHGVPLPEERALGSRGKNLLGEKGYPFLKLSILSGLEEG